MKKIIEIKEIFPNEPLEFAVGTCYKSPYSSNLKGEFGFVKDPRKAIEECRGCQEVVFKYNNEWYILDRIIENGILALLEKEYFTHWFSKSFSPYFFKIDLE